MFLIVIKPPNNAMITFQKMKLEVYRRTGLVSAWALPPVVPVASVGACDLNFTRKELPVIPDGGFELSKLKLVDSQYCLGSDSLTDFCCSAAEYFAQSEGFSYSFRGLHLFDSREAKEDESISAVKLAGELTDNIDESVKIWKSCTLEIFQAEADIFKKQEWWKMVEYETVYSISFPKTRRQ